MEYRKLGRTGLMVSELCLGTMTFGNEADEQTSKSVADRFVEAGGNFVGTANVYSRGVSEEITGRARVGAGWCRLVGGDGTLAQQIGVRAARGGGLPALAPP